MIKLTDTVPEKDTTIKTLEEIKIEKIASPKKDSSPLTGKISIKQNHASQKKTKQSLQKKNNDSRNKENSRLCISSYKNQA